MKLNPQDLDANLITPKCQPYLKPLLKKKKAILFKTIGSPINNQLLDLVYCQSKTHKQCKSLEKVYKSCHASVMGIGSYEGRKNCAMELEALVHCAVLDKES